MIPSQESFRTITTGAILVEKSTLLPEPLHLEGDSMGNGWMPVAVNLDAHQLEKKLSAAGWTFFWMGGAIRTTVFGFKRPNMLHAALKRLIIAAKRQKCNCLEIDDIATHTFLGLPYISLSAHARHIQKEMIFCGL